MLRNFYSKLILKYPLRVLSFLFCALLVFSYYAFKLEIDASAETLLLQNDRDLEFSRQMKKRYEKGDFLVITYEPKEDLLSKTSLDDLKSLSQEILKLPRVESIVSILNVPLLLSPVRGLKDLLNDIKKLQDNKSDKTLVKKEFLNSPLYRNNLVSTDFKTTSLLINLKKDEQYFFLLEQRNALKAKQYTQNLNRIEKEKLKNLNFSFKAYRDKIRKIEHLNIQEIRNIIKKYENNSRIFLGGVNMIADDIVTFVKNDLLVYGSALILILMIVLFLIFKEIKWVLIPILICVCSVIASAGALGFFAWEITVISSNFIALQLIITISIILHLIVRYNELAQKYSKTSQKNLVLNTMLSKFKPSFFAIITTIAGFASLIFSGIAPVINLGWMMSVGIFLSLLLSFIIFPAILICLPKTNKTKSSIKKYSFIQTSANFVQNDSYKIYLFTGFFILISFFGISKLIVENSFISYFKKDTQIYKSMLTIDEKLGGTTPLDIILTFQNEDSFDEENEDSFDEENEDSFDEEFEEEAQDDKYWFTQDKMDKIHAVHNYLSSLEEIGFVQSFASLLQIGKLLNENEELDSFKLALLYNEIPLEYKDLVLSPYINIEFNQVRFSTRIIDSNPSLRRDELIKKIYKDLEKILPNDEIRLSGLMILYNNMLQSLFDSQIKTMFLVILILFFMFLLLFRSFKIALIAIFSNLVPIGIIFAFMGLGGIPLDIMTITIAAISIGIGVDDTIHYIHRYKEEFQKDKSYVNAMQRSHNTIGYAMTYTSLAVILGFSILVLSNLIPTIYFGLLTVVVMFSILASALLLLPKLLIHFKVFDKS